MLKKLVNLIILTTIAVLAWFLNLKYATIDLNNIFYSFVAITFSYLIFKLILEGMISRQIKESKTRYSFRKTTQILFIIISFVIVLRIWVPDPQALLVAYGLFAAGVAIALQDIFKNFAGAVSIFLSGIYQVGDRIEIDNKYGDVIDIGLFYTSLIELREWVDGDQTTGRITLLPNGKVLSSFVHNYTKDHSFIWDEISIPVTHNSDWKEATDLIQKIVKKETEKITEYADQEISHLEEKYYLSKRNIEPAIFVTLTDNWIMLNARYVVDAKERRLIKNEITKLIIDGLQKNSDITIASQTITVVSSLSSRSEIIK